MYKIFFNKKIKVLNKKSKGFTILELLVSIGIFAMMTALLIAKYGTFNQGVLLTNLAYDVALSIRNAQFYGLNVKSSSRVNNYFTNPYGVYFKNGTGNFVFFVDSGNSPNNINYIYDNPEVEKLTLTTIRRGGIISDLCVSNGDVGASCNTVSELNISFKRPNPNAIITVDGNIKYQYAEITLRSSDGSTKKVIVRGNGQITVK